MPRVTSPIRDRDIRAVLIEAIRHEHAADPETRVVNELGVLNGRTRIDLAVINGLLHGYEIKSAADTLTRLPRQVICYGAIFDCVTLVTTGEHIVKARHLIPRWWGITKVSGSAESPVLRAVRKAKRNPVVNPVALAQLLWRDEAIELLERYEIAQGFRGKARRALWQHLARSLPRPVLADAVRSALLSRPGWRVAGQPR